MYLRNYLKKDYFQEQDVFVFWWPAGYVSLEKVFCMIEKYDGLKLWSIILCFKFLVLLAIYMAALAYTRQNH